jgi:hypothetical protein
MIREKTIDIPPMRYPMQYTITIGYSSSSSYVV